MRLSSLYACMFLLDLDRTADSLAISYNHSSFIFVSGNGDQWKSLPLQVQRRMQKGRSFDTS